MTRQRLRGNPFKLDSTGWGLARECLLATTSSRCALAGKDRRAQFGRFLSGRDDDTELWLGADGRVFHVDSLNGRTLKSYSLNFEACRSPLEAFRPRDADFVLLVGIGQSTDDRSGNADLKTCCWRSHSIYPRIEQVASWEGTMVSSFSSPNGRWLAGFHRRRAWEPYKIALCDLGTGEMRPIPERAPGLHREALPNSLVVNDRGEVFFAKYLARRLRLEFYGEYGGGARDPLELPIEIVDSDQAQLSLHCDIDERDRLIVCFPACSDLGIPILELCLFDFGPGDSAFQKRGSVRMNSVLYHENIFWRRLELPILLSPPLHAFLPGHSSEPQAIFEARRGKLSLVAHPASKESCRWELDVQKATDSLLLSCCFRLAQLNCKLLPGTSIPEIEGWISDCRLFLRERAAESFDQ